MYNVKTMIADWNDLIKTKIPEIEYEIKRLGANELDNDFIVVYLSLVKHSLVFEFDVLGNNTQSFDGLTKTISKINNRHKIALKHFENLNQALEHINQDVTQYIYENGYEII